MTAIRKLLLASSLLGIGGLAYADAKHPFKLRGSDTMLTVGGYAKLDALWSHFWTPDLRSTLEISAASSTPPDATANGVNLSDRSQHLNLIWSPVAAANLGVELIQGRRTVVGGDSGSLNRLQLSAQYLF